MVLQEIAKVEPLIAELVDGKISLKEILASLD